MESNSGAAFNYRKSLVLLVPSLLSHWVNALWSTFMYRRRLPILS